MKCFVHQSVKRNPQENALKQELQKTSIKLKKSTQSKDRNKKILRRKAVKLSTEKSGKLRIFLCKIANKSNLKKDNSIDDEDFLKQNEYNDKHVFTDKDIQLTYKIRSLQLQKHERQALQTCQLFKILELDCLKHYQINNFSNSLSLIERLVIDWKQLQYVYNNKLNSPNQTILKRLEVYQQEQKIIRTYLQSSNFICKNKTVLQWLFFNVQLFLYAIFLKEVKLLEKDNLIKEELQKLFASLQTIKARYGVQKLLIKAVQSDKIRLTTQQKQQIQNISLSPNLMLLEQYIQYGRYMNQQMYDVQNWKKIHVFLTSLSKALQKLKQVTIQCQ